MQFASHSQAVAAYNADRTRLHVQVSPAARAYGLQHPRPFKSTAGLAEVQAEFDFRPMPAFILAPLGLTNDDLLRDARKFARKVQEAKELALRLRAQKSAT